jgi:hypothetical protein
VEVVVEIEQRRLLSASEEEVSTKGHETTDLQQRVMQISEVM